MKITVIAVGKPHNNIYKPAIKEFEKRLVHYAPLSWVYISTSNIEKESEQLLKKVTGYTILLDETGGTLNTPALAGRLDNLQNTSVKNVTFIIGGAYGVTGEVKERADFMWSLSELVFPHQLVRLILLEQLYRAYDILSGGNYHHE